ncbi:GH21929 [Drosophila grimshawi]|uniref:GH21929 n=1 Tax=Drosophila grimshawi TaxID=7222 RepID=B4J8G8_DROGR|nr:GH21929 [Drosophila grimshawi]
MADDPVNQRAFAEDVAAAAAAGGDQGFAMPPPGSAGPGSPDFKMPSAEDIWKMVESMEGISDTEREELRESIFNPQASSPEDFMKQYGQPGHSSREYIVFFVMIALILIVFGKHNSSVDPRPKYRHTYL